MAVRINYSDMKNQHPVYIFEPGEQERGQGALFTAQEHHFKGEKQGKGEGL